MARGGLHPLKGLAGVDSPESSRLVFKRVFLNYYLDLCSLSIADPTEAFAACRAYLGSMWERLGRDEFMARLDDETTGVVGQLDQELRRLCRDEGPRPPYDDLEDRVRECFEHALRRTEITATEIQVE